MTASYYYIFRSEYNVQFICHNHILERDWKWKCYMTGCDGTVISDCSVVWLKEFLIALYSTGMKYALSLTMKK